MLASLATVLSLLISAPDCTMVPGSGLQRIDLQATSPGSSATGTIILEEVDASGTFDARVSVQKLPDPGTLGPNRVWVAWAASHRLDRIIKLGPVTNADVLLGRVDSTTPMFMVSAESDTAVTRFGALILVGRCRVAQPGR